jgi:quercetin dioxygenase-like cupin family protein
MPPKADGGMQAGETVALSSMVEYHDSSVVSRTLIDKPSGTLTLFSFDKGQGLSEHQAPFDAFVQIIDGSATISISGVAHELVAGQAIIMPANKPHAVRAPSRFKMLLTMIKS